MTALKNILTSFALVATTASGGASVALAEPSVGNAHDYLGCTMSFSGIEEDKSGYVGFADAPMNFAVFDVTNCENGTPDYQLLMTRRHVAESVYEQDRLSIMDDVLIEDKLGYLKQYFPDISRARAVEYLEESRDNPVYPEMLMAEAFNAFSAVLCTSAEYSVFEQEDHLDQSNPPSSPFIVDRDYLHPAALCPAAF